jgi:hypothetical protein
MLLTGGKAACPSRVAAHNQVGNGPGSARGYVGGDDPLITEHLALPACRVRTSDCEGYGARWRNEGQSKTPPKIARFTVATIGRFRTLANEGCNPHLRLAMEDAMIRTLLVVCVAIAGLTEAWAQARADDLPCVRTTFRFIGKNDRVCVGALDDPKVPGVVCHVSQARTRGLTGWLASPKTRREFRLHAVRSVPSTWSWPHRPIRKKCIRRAHPSFSSATTSTKGWTRNVTRWSISPSAIS